MIRTVLLLGLLASLAACGDGQPLFPDEDGGSGDGDGDGDGNDNGGGGIRRSEEQTDEGSGYVEDVSYDRKSDTFFVDNLAFDGDNVYTRDDDVRTLNDQGGRARYRVYEGDEVARDPQNGEVVQQATYRAIYGESENRISNGQPRTSFAIVRTGSYVDYGFGGFVYERNGGVDLPTNGQAAYSGDYAGLRTFSGVEAGNRLEYTTGEVNIDIDFRDFNEGRGVQGIISDRRAFDLQGNRIVTGPGEDQLQLPDLFFDVGPGTFTGDGEMSNGLRSYAVDDEGSLEEYESGTYYAIVAGDNADEIVGVFVVESDDPRFDDVTAQETGGFIVYR